MLEPHQIDLLAQQVTLAVEAGIKNGLAPDRNAIALRFAVAAFGGSYADATCTLIDEPRMAAGAFKMADAFIAERDRRKP